MIVLRVANAAQLRLSLVVQNVHWRWRKSHQNKNRTAPRLRTRETCGSESVPTGGEPPLAHASGYKKGSRCVYMLGCQLPSDRFGGSSGFGVALLLLVGSSAISFCAEPGPTPTCVNIADAFIKVPVLPSRLSRASERRPQVPMLIACLIAVSLLSVAALGFALLRARTSERGRERLARELSSLRGLVEAEGGRAERHEARLAELSAAQAEARREIEAARARELERERGRELDREKGWELETAKGEGESRASYDSGSGGDYGTTGCAYLDSMIASAHEDGPGVSDTSNAAGEAAAGEEEAGG